MCHYCSHDLVVLFLLQNKFFLIIDWLILGLTSLEHFVQVVYTGIYRLEQSRAYGLVKILHRKPSHICKQLPIFFNFRRNWKLKPGLVTSEARHMISYRFV